MTLPSHKSCLLLLDTGIVVEAFRQGIWEKLIANYKVTLSPIIVSESIFYEGKGGRRVDIDIEPYVRNNQVVVQEVGLNEVLEFKKIFANETIYLDRFDPGETELMACWYATFKDQAFICSADGIVFKTLGRLNAGDRGVSLEELLLETGQTKKLEWKFSKKFRLRYTDEGGTDFIYRHGD